MYLYLSLLPSLSLSLSLSLLSSACYSSNPLHSHTEPIAGLDVNTRLHLFVSCGRDMSVRVWSKDNNIIR